MSSQPAGVRARGAAPGAAPLEPVVGAQAVELATAAVGSRGLGGIARYYYSAAPPLARIRAGIIIKRLYRASIMVRKGAFGLRLIDAATDAPLEEYCDDALATWVAGEPDKEYWIELTAEEFAGDGTIATLLVDNKGVGHAQVFRNGHSTTRKVGVFKRDVVAGEECVHNSLAFASVVSSEDGGDDNLPSYGTVTVLYHTGERTAQFASRGGGRFEAVSGSRAPSSNQKKEGIGMLKSALGEAKRASGNMDTCNWESRDLLQELTIRYSTRFGLVVRRIVSEPQPAHPEGVSRIGPIRQARQAARARKLQQSGRAPDAPINLLDDDEEEEAPVAYVARPVKRQHVLVD